MHLQPFQQPLYSTHFDPPAPPVEPDAFPPALTACRSLFSSIDCICVLSFSARSRYSPIFVRIRFFLRERVRITVGRDVSFVVLLYLAEMVVDVYKDVPSSWDFFHLLSKQSDRKACQKCYLLHPARRLRMGATRQQTMAGWSGGDSDREV